MTRLTMEVLETLAHARRRAIEVDEAAGIAVLIVGHRVYYADLPKVAAK